MIGKEKRITMDIILLILIIVSILLGALVRNIFGFGEALVTMPLLALLNVDYKLSISIVAIVGIIVAFPVFVSNRQNINWKILKRLLIGSIIGTPIGILVVALANENIITKFLGIFILIYGTLNLINQFKNLYQSKLKIPPLYDYVAGIISGVLGSAYNSHGVPIVIYGTLKKWDFLELKKISQVHFFITGCIIVASHGLSGFWNTQLWWLLAITLPFLFITIILGNILSHKINQNTLIKYIYLLLICFGIIMIMK